MLHVLYLYNENLKESNLMVMVTVENTMLAHKFYRQLVMLSFKAICLYMLLHFSYMKVIE